MDLGPKEEKRKLVFGEILAAQLKKSKLLKSKMKKQIFYKSVSGKD